MDLGVSRSCLSMPGERVAFSNCSVLNLGEVVVEEDQHRAVREALLLGEEDSLFDVFALCRLPGFSILQSVIEDIYL